MDKFWQFARGMLRYRRLLTVMAVAVVLDALCAVGGLASLMWIIQTVFVPTEIDGQIATVQSLCQAKIDGLKGTLAQPIADLAGPWVQHIPASPFGGLVFIMSVILVLAVIGSIMRYTYQSAAFTISLYTVARIRKQAFDRLVHAPTEVSLSQGTADNLTRIVKDCSQLARGFNTLTSKAIRQSLLGFGALGLAFVANWKLTAVFLIGMPLTAVCLKQFGKRIRRAAKRANRAYGMMLSAIQESIQGVSVVKVHTAEGYERRRFNTINRRVLGQELRARRSRAMSAPVIELLGIISIMLVTLTAAYLTFVMGASDPSEVLAVLLFLGASAASLKPLSNLNNDLQEATAAAIRVDEVITLPVEPSWREEAGKQLALATHSQSVRFEDVTYRYPGKDTDVLGGINLDVRFGETVAIVGTNGAGKSTLLSMLPRLIEPATGRVLIDGEDIQDHTLRSLRKQIAVVTQQTVLFEGTIADNIAYGQRHIGMDRILEAARLAHADSFVDELPEGYATLLGEGGTGLSGGQKQRLAIARAILRDPAILILDEATSQIDADSEAKIADALQQFRQGRTTFIIAHRLSTVVNSDQIVVMDAGRVVDAGKHDELLERCELYQMLTRTQL